MGRKSLTVFLVGCFALLILATPGPGLRASVQSALFLLGIHPDGKKEFRLINAGDDVLKGTADDET